jgi:hypothetical protein
MTLFPLFATGVMSLTPVANLPLVSLVVDTGVNLLPVSTTPAVPEAKNLVNLSL